jgi:hypothetical protein
MADRVAPPGTLDVGPALGLPPLGRSRVVMYGRASNPAEHAALRTLAAAAFVEHGKVHVALMQRIDPRADRTDLAGRDHHVDDRRRRGEHRLDGAVAAVAHPAVGAMPISGLRDEGAKADALHAAVQHHMADDTGASHAPPPVLAPRLQGRARDPSDIARLWDAGDATA